MHNLNKINKETDLVSSIANFLLRFEYNLHFEVPVLGQSADIVAFKNESLTLVEAKMHDWKRGINQCRTHELVADYICLAVATVNISEKLEHIAKVYGYGIIHCNPKTGICDWFVLPQMNENIWNPQRQLFIKSLRNLDNGN